VVSFNTRDLLCESLTSIQDACADIDHEIIVVDNASRDGSADMVEKEFPHMVLVRAQHNLGFAGANNLGRESACGEYIAMINPDAFPEAGALRKAVDRMAQNPRIGMAGGLLIGKDGQFEPSARLFPSPLNDLLAISGLSAKYAKSRFFGRFDRTWADPYQAASVDWVPGAFAVVKNETLDKIGFFDLRFFLYYEEVDLCYRMREAGYSVEYWPDLKAVHWGGESSKTVTNQSMSSSGRQLTLWRMRSELLYYRKHHGWLTARLAAWVEMGWHTLRQWVNGGSPDKRAESERIVQTMRQAWNETSGGRVSPPTPW
jgi:hypothetical protein